MEKVFYQSVKWNGKEREWDRKKETASTWEGRGFREEEIGEAVMKMK